MIKEVGSGAYSGAKVLKRSWKRKQIFQNQALPDFQTLEFATTLGGKCNNNNNNNIIESITRAWYEMKSNGKRNGMENSLWNMEDARMEWNGRFQEWNGGQSSIPIP